MSSRTLTILNATACVLCTIVAITSVAVTRGTPMIEFQLNNETYAADPGGMVAAFLFVSAAEHSGVLWFSGYYDRSLYTISTHRWISYAISAPLMIVIINASIGILNIYTNIFAASITTTVIATGYLYELDRLYAWKCWKEILACGFLYLTVLFTAIWYQFSTFDAPPIVSAIILCMSICYWSFGAVPLVSVLVNERAPYVGSETAYVCLSITSKLILAGLFIARYVMLKSEAESDP